MRKIFLVSVMLLLIGLLLQIDTKAYSDSFLIGRFLENGNLDYTFNSRGFTTARVQWGYDHKIGAVITDRVGKIVTAGTVSFGNGKRFAIVRHNQDGTLDTTFGTNGFIVTQFPIANADQYGTAIAIDSYERIVVGGYSLTIDATNFVMARYNNNGTIDRTFGTNGLVVSNLLYSAHEAINSIVLHPHGAIYAAGWANVAGETKFVVARYTSLGRLDPTFYETGYHFLSFPDSRFAFATAIALRPEDSSIYVAGKTIVGDKTHFAIVGLNKSGRKIYSFGNYGQVVTDFAGYQDEWINGIKLDKSGRIVVAGYAKANNGRTYFAVARYNGGGRLDTTFNSGGSKFFNFGAINAEAKDLILDSAGRILVCGYAYDGISRVAVTRLLANGITDGTFGHGGVYRNFQASTNEFISAISIDLDGNIVVAGDGKRL